jgi:hypothetical protein
MNKFIGYVFCALTLGGMVSGCDKPTPPPTTT